MDFLNLNESVKTAIRIAQGISRGYGNGCYTSAHLLKALLHKEIGLHGFIQSLDKDLEYLEEWAEVRIDEVPKQGTAKIHNAGNTNVTQFPGGIVNNFKHSPTKSKD